MFSVHFLKASSGVPMTKSFSLAESKIEKSSYPHILNFDSSTESVETIQQMYGAIVDNADQGACLLKGTIEKDLANESRAGKTDPNTPTQWLCLDLDGVPIKHESELISYIPALQNVSYIRQYSASAGFEDDGRFRAHLFFILDTPIAPTILKNWLIHLNLTVPILRDSLTLTRTGNTLKWPLDVTVAQNDKLIYIAPPVLSEQIEDPIEERISLVEIGKPTVTIPVGLVHPERLAIDKLNVLNELRRVAKLPQRKRDSFKLQGDIEVLRNPGTAQVTGQRIARGFTYLNLNGGDSWGYYHPTDNPTVIFNFKGEPNYLTKELLPEYYAQAVAKAKEAPGPAEQQKRGVYWLAFREKSTDQYYVGMYDYDNDSLDINPVSSETKVKHFLKEHGQPVGDFIPTWRYELDYGSDVEFDPQRKFINRYIRSKYLKNPNRECKQLPPFFDKLITHTFGEFKDDFLNWLAVITQTRKRTDMAWILTGIQGSGKSVINHCIFQPLFGPYVHTLHTIEAFDHQFNNFCESLIVFVNECSMSDSYRSSTMANRVKSFVTDPTISIRKMRQDSYMMENHANFVFTSNQHDPMKIDPDDRRFFPVWRQEKRLLKAGITVDDVEKNYVHELYDLAGFLMNYPIDIERAKTPISSAEKDKMIHLGRDSIQVCVDAIKKGNLEFFVDNTPNVEDLVRLESAVGLDLSYKAILQRFFDNMNQPISVTRQELQVLFYYAAEIQHRSPNKFTSILKHKSLDITTIRMENGRLAKGVPNIVWKADDETQNMWESIKRADSIIAN